MMHVGIAHTHFTVLCILWSVCLGLTDSKLFPDHRGRCREDQIEFLPGIDGDQPSFRHYSGYLQASHARRLHYWLVESQRDPDSDPLIIWMNGGPGCSSLNGFLGTNGPFRLNPDGRITYNDFAWNKFASAIYLEAPAGVGFSYATDRNYTTDDEQTADDNHRALWDFMEKFPVYQGRELYITGESYAGVYIPTLLVRLAADPRFNLKGAAIGNGLLQTFAANMNSNFFYWYHHGLVDHGTWKELQDACCGAQGTEDDCQFVFPKDIKCASLVLEILPMFYGSPIINMYNYLSECYHPDTVKLMATQKQWLTQHLAVIFQRLQGHNETKFGDDIVMLAKKQDVLPCISGMGPATYLNRRDVRRALHILSQRVTQLPDWFGCSSLVDDAAEVGTYHTYYTFHDAWPLLVPLVESQKYKILLYYGDLDYVCSMYTGQTVLHKVAQNGSPEHLEPYDKWYYSSDVDGSRQVAGHTQRYKGLRYVSIRAAGHMSPEDQPMVTLDMLHRLLQGGGAHQDGTTDFPWG